MELQEQVDRIKKLAGGETGVVHIEIQHEAGCPSLLTHRMQDCTCQPEIRKMEREDRDALVRYKNRR